MKLHNRANVRPQLETLEARRLAAVDAFIWFRTGVVEITPPADQAPSQNVQINHQVSQVTLPSGDLLPGHGLKTAEANTPVVDWTPT
jgi:hypothetical protein